MRVNQSGSNPIQGNEVPPKGGSRTQGNKDSKEAMSGKSTGRADGVNRASVQGNPAASGSSAKKNITHAETAEISPKAKEFAQVKSAASQAPDVREEKIAELKRRIAEGSYKIKADAIADRLVDEHLSSPIR